MAFYSKEKIYLAYVDTINDEATYNEKPIISKIVALKLVGMNKKTKVVNYKPIRNYEYHSIRKVVPINRNVGMFGFISDNDINREIKKLGRPEAKQLLKRAN